MNKLMTNTRSHMQIAKAPGVKGLGPRATCQGPGVNDPRPRAIGQKPGANGPRAHGAKGNGAKGQGPRARGLKPRVNDVLMILTIIILNCIMSMTILNRDYYYDHAGFL